MNLLSPAGMWSCPQLQIGLEPLPEMQYEKILCGLTESGNSDSPPLGAWCHDVACPSV